MLNSVAIDTEVGRIEFPLKRGEDQEAIHALESPPKPHALYSFGQLCEIKGECQVGRIDSEGVARV
jgi:hypothetical protein